MIETTCNISLQSYTKISYASKNHKIHIKKLISCILQECIKIKIQQKTKPSIFEPVRYQNKNGIEKEWKLIHVNIQESLYESCIDYRRLYKVSVSSVLEWGIKYLVEIVIEKIHSNNNSEPKTDNYRIDFKLQTFFNDNFIKLSYHGSIKLKTG